MKTMISVYLFMAVAALSIPAQAAAFHSADVNKDRRISLSELLRVIQFFNSGGYGCDLSGEDGYSVDKTDQSCALHNSDYNPQDWKIDLSELLRIIQLFNAGGYYGPVISEDGYLPGKGGNPYLLPVEGDTDGDGLTDEEEGYLNMNPAVADEDGDGVPDGAGLALKLAREVAELPLEQSEGVWRYIWAGDSRVAADPFSGETITLYGYWLRNELMDDDTGYMELPYGARYFLDHGSFSYIPVDEQCQWLEGESERIPAHVLYYLLYSSPEFLPDTHLVPVENDSDGDYLSDAEENAIGYASDDPDENENGVPDGQDLARAMADKVFRLPWCEMYKSGAAEAKGLAKCGVWASTPPAGGADKVISRCVDIIEMDCEFFDPVLGIHADTDYYVNTSDGGFMFSGLLLQVMRIDGSFNYYTCHYGCETHRLDVPYLFDLLNMRGETQPAPSSHLIPLVNDDDGDYLSNDEEHSIGSDPGNPDEDENGVADGIDLAHAFAAAVRALPRCGFEIKEADKAFFSCSKADRAAQLERIWNAAPEEGPKKVSACAQVLEYDCVLEDPVLGVAVGDDEYRVHLCSEDQCYYGFSADSLMLYIMEHEGSLGFYSEEEGEWVYRRIPVYTWNRVLNR